MPRSAIQQRCVVAAMDDITRRSATEINLMKVGTRTKAIGLGMGTVRQLQSHHVFQWWSAQRIATLMVMKP